MTAPTSEEVQAMCSRLRDRRELHQHCEDAAADLIERLALKVLLYKAGNAELYDRLEARDKFIEELEEELENRDASAVHSCSPHCQRPMCVLRREKERAEQQRDEYKPDAEAYRELLQVMQETTGNDQRITEQNRLSVADMLKTIGDARIRAMGADNDD